MDKMAGSKAHCIALTTGILLLLGCGSGGTDGDTSNLFNQPKLLASLGQNVILPDLRLAKAAADALQTATSNYEAAVIATTDDIAEKQESARAAWRAFSVIWHRVEIYQVGPLASSADDIVGAQNLRDRIYSWPTIETCDIDEHTESKAYESPTFIADNLVLAYGLDALEYLLFTDSTAHTCEEEDKTALDPGWDLLDADAITLRRSTYARVVAADIAVAVAAALSAWEPNEGNFLKNFAEAGKTGSVYKTSQIAIDDLLAAMFFLEIEVKEAKLGEPMAIIGDTCATACPENLESQWARHAKENVIANLRGFESLFLGGGSDNHGFDDVLNALNAQTLATQMKADLTAAIAAFEALPDSLYETVKNNPSAGASAYTALSKVTGTLKGEFLTTLKLQIPKEGSGDAD